MLRDRRVLVLLVLVLSGSVLSVVLALSRQAPAGAGVPPGPTGGQAPGFRPAELAGPGGDALAAAVTGMSTAYAYDHADLDGSLEAATRLMTPRYAAAYTRLFDSGVRPSARRQRAVVDGLVRGAGVVRTSGEANVVCLLYVDQVLAEGRRLPASERARVLTRSRLRVAMVLRDGAWRIDDIAPVQTFPAR